MLAKHSRGSGLLDTVFLLAALCGIVPAQTPAPKQDPLQHLLAADRPEDPKRIRFHVSLLSVPVREAAKAMLDDTAEHPDFWPNQLLKWRDAGLLENVANYGTEAADGEDYGQSQPQKFRFIHQGYASRFWLDHQECKEAQMPPPDPNELLQMLSEADIGNFFRARVNMKLGWQQAEVQFKLLHCPQPASRPTTTWPLPAFTAPRYLFRPWSLNGFATGRINVPFLLGAQMEPPHDGKVATGHLWMAFGRITLPERNGYELDEKLADIQPQHRVQTWTLAVDRSLFLPWIFDRQTSEGDGRALTTWLQRAIAQDGVELLATAAVGTAPSRQTELTSTLHWEDATGFEPGGSRTEFRANVCEADIYSLQHALSVALEPAPVAAVELRSDPFAPPPLLKHPPAAWFVNLIMHRPPAATVWKKLKSAMERDDNDPNAVEIGAAELGDFKDDLQGVLNRGRGDGVQAGMIVVPNQVIMAGACMKQDRVHVSFLRLAREERAPPAAGENGRAPKVPARLETATSTIWAIETPLSWQNKLLGQTDLNLHALGRELLGAVGNGTASVAGITSQTQGGGYKDAVSAAGPQIFMGGDYVNTAPAPKGIFFNTRNVGHELVGDRVELHSDTIENSPDRMLSFTIRSVRKPEWRHWGVWQPGVAGTNAGNSGIEQPVFPIIKIEGRMRLQPQVPQVMAVLRLAQLGSPASKGEDRLRWYVVRRDSLTPAAAAVAKANVTRFAGYIDRPVVIQAVVVKTPRASTENAEASAAALLRQAREGELPVLDLVTFAKAGDATATVAGGWDWHFTNGREFPRGGTTTYSEHLQAAFKAPAVMPAGTSFSNQVYRQNRIAGFEFRIEGAEFTMVRDAKAPDIVTDSFSKVLLEWPGPFPGQDWKEMPRVTVNVQRPIFAIQEAKGDLPNAGESTVSRLSDDTVLIIRTLK